ncbi:MAG: ABC transporter ATP-binding protein [Burkholderiaceae bacterium]|nr:ABC transporter ATP-binding protein [Burkholderiaceae bacterium]
MSTPVIEARGLTLHAAGRLLVAGLDWQARSGERWCVIGRNAVGKSTLLRALAGLSVPARAGHVEWLGREQSAWAMADAAAVRAFAPQQANDRFPIAVRRLLELAVCVPREAAPTALLPALDVEALASRNVMQLSGGERQRVALAQCAVQGAPLLLLDEPVAFQDPAHQLQIARWLASLTDRCLVVTAHDVNWIAAVATHVLALHGDGRWEAGPAAQMLDAARLEAIYGCRWRQADGAWLTVA